jgi:hypothetical protein
VTEIVVHRTDGEGLPARTRRGLVEPIDARVTRLLGLALPAEGVPVSEIGFDAQLGAMAAASKAALASDLACYLRWCDDKRIAPLPAEPEDLVRYIAMLEARGAKPATVARRRDSCVVWRGLAGPPAQPGNDANHDERREYSWYDERQGRRNGAVYRETKDPCVDREHGVEDGYLCAQNAVLLCL